MQLQNHTKLFALALAAGITLTACDENKPEPASLSPSLPELNAPIVDCEEAPYALSAEEWFSQNDAFVVGTVRALQPALDPAWSDGTGALEKGILSADRCASVSSGFAVELDTHEVVGLDGGSPDLSKVHFGYSHFSAWAAPPTVSDDSVHWTSEDNLIAPGMRIALMVRQEQSTGRWAPALGRGEALFSIHDGILHGQALRQERCGPNPPLEELEGTPVDNLVERLRAVKLDDETQGEVDTRRANEQDAANPNSATNGPDWFASCDAPAETNVGAECEQDDDCKDNTICTNGRCVDAP